MPTIVMTDNDFGDCSFERNMVEAAHITFINAADVTSLPMTELRTPAQLIKSLAHADGAIASYGHYTAEVFAACPHLKVVSKTGTGVDNIDVAYATANNTAVCNVPGYGTEVVSDHALALALTSIRRINEIDADMHAGTWDFRRHRPLGQISGRTFGVVGYGAIGKACARKAAGIGFSVVVWDRSLTPGGTTEAGYPILNLEQLLQTADTISFHVALTPDTYHLLNKDNLTLLKPNAIVVNTSRGAVIDTVALAEALNSEKLWGAALDVFEEEPLSADAPICHAKHTVLTSHAAYWSEESIVELRKRCTQNAIDVVLGKTPDSCVNPEVLPAAFAK